MIKIFPKQTDLIKGYKKDKNLVVLSHKFFCDHLTPLSIYHRIRKFSKKESFLLESVEGEEKISRFSFIGFDPIACFKTKEKQVFIDNLGVKESFKFKKDPFVELDKLMKKFKVWPKENIRFFGGFVGFMGYDAVKFYEPVGKAKEDDLDSFDSYFILPKFLIVFDHIAKQIEILSFFPVSSKNEIKQKYLQESKEIEKILNLILTPAKLSALDIPTTHKEIKSLLKKSGLKMKSNFKKKDFIKAVEKAKEYIRSGDIIQVVLSQRFSVAYKKDPFLAYRYLRLLNPSPYMYFLDFKDTKIVGSSPEMLLRCENDILVTRPIAGTRRRGKTEEEDIFFEKELLADPKERAEHVMLVDLGRNDIGRVSKKASVFLPFFMKIERFSHVMHIVSEVRGFLNKKNSKFEALKSCFPAGTVSGAPKVRAMQIINELEEQKRGIYSGCIGYFSFTNSLDTCIIIRTILFKNNKAYIQAGAGIVYDSVPELEHKEILNKAMAQLVALTLTDR